ncbi:Hypothetical protein PHPALM_17925 [Phytophthora palmivora]|uniref:Uncharacterized protein n=1 Tax=Phytophthora palmivora TaxID=4796 RepID=A0A2P4XL28_9STRA|nr:Hypothetical protein PHPALM_17925 [Phytophthora palmivora]
MAEVHSTWRTAGANGDVVTMRLLKSRFPEWLDLQRVNVSLTQHSTFIQDVIPNLCHDAADSTSSCSWSDFDLDTLGASALHTSCRDELQESVTLVISIIKLLLRFGASIDAQDQNGRTALHCSTSDDAFEVAKYLVDANAKIDARDQDGKTPLHYCIEEGGLLVTNLLLSCCASIDVVNKNGVSPLLLVVQRADVTVLQLFLNYHQWVVTPPRLEFSSTVMMLAVDNNVEVVVQFMVDNRYASVDIRNSRGETPLHRAILRHNRSLIGLLLELDTTGGSIVATTTEEDQTPLHYAALYGSSREVEALLLHLANMVNNVQRFTDTNLLNAVDREGATCLYDAGVAVTFTRGYSTQLGVVAASRWDRDTKVQLLLDHGARLFSVGYLIRELTPDNSSRLVLPAQVKQCLQNYLLESKDYDYSRDREYEDPRLGRVRSIEMESFTELCVQWISSVVYAGPSATLLVILTSAGYGQETLPLLLDLPIRRDAFGAWLRRLEKLARCHGGHALLLQLHNELLQAWNSL